MAKSMYVRITKKASDSEAALTKHYPDALDRQAIQQVELPWMLGPFKPNVAQELLNSISSGGGQGELLDGSLATQGAELVAGGVPPKSGARKKAAKKGGTKRAAKKPAAKKAGGAKAKKAGGAKAKKAGGAKAKKAGAKRGKR
jgi:hypothetical protein